MKEFMDVRCILLCKSFQGKKSAYNLYWELSNKLSEEIGDSFSQYSIFGEYDGVFSYKIPSSQKPLLKEIENNNKLLAEQMSDSIFFKSLYLIYPANEKYTEETDKFWNTESPFFFVSVIHMDHCCVDLETIKCGREHIIKLIDDKKKEAGTNWVFRYRVYYSLDLSDYIIVWKTEEPAHVMEAIRYLYENSNFIGYTNTVCALPTQNFDDLEKTKTILGEKKFSMSIQAVAKSYSEARKMHKKIVEEMENKYEIQSKPCFSMGNDDYLGFFHEVLPAALYDLYYILMNDTNFDNAILSINTTLAIDGYSSGNANVDYENGPVKKLDAKTEESLNNAKAIKLELACVCHDIKQEFISLFNENQEVFNRFFWKKTLVELMVLLDNMSKSTVFDSACFLFLDSTHLFLSFIKYLRCKNQTDEELICALKENELHIETFIREWEQLINHVVQIDGAFQKTPGYEPLNYNISQSIVEFHNAFAQKVIQYFSSLDENNLLGERTTCITSFVVPKLCRRFKTIQWFFDNRAMDSLLFITIPVSQMFETFSNMVALTHEISHYVSNDMRRRELRTKTLLLCVASIICSSLKINSNNTIDLAFEMLAEIFNKESHNNYDCYLSDLSSISKRVAFRFLDKVDNLNKLFYCYIKDHMQEYGCEPSDKTGMAMKIRRISTHLIGVPSSVDSCSFNDFSSIYSLIDDVILLIKEGYADLMMIYVLGLKPEQYLRESFKELLLFNNKNDYKKFYFKYQRVLVVCETLILSGFWSRAQVEQIEENGLDFDEKYRNICYEFIRVFKEWHENDIEEKNYALLFFDNDVIYAIIRYLQNCMEIIQEREVESDSVEMRKNIANLFDIMTSKEKEGLFSTSFQNELQENRINVINKWKNKEESPYIFG